MYGGCKSMEFSLVFPPLQPLVAMSGKEVSITMEFRFRPKW